MPMFHAEPLPGNAGSSTDNSWSAALRHSVWQFCETLRGCRRRRGAAAGWELAGPIGVQPRLDVLYDVGLAFGPRYGNALVGMFDNYFRPSVATRFGEGQIRPGFSAIGGQAGRLFE